MTYQAPLFSIVIPCYNYGHCIERAVLSVINQTCNDYELLVINDGSTDNSEEVIRSLQENYSSLKFITNPNQGLAATRNAGIKHTHGDFLVFLDADDELIPDAVENLKVHHLSNPNDKMIIGGHISVDSKTKKEKYHLPKALPEIKEERFRGYLIDKTVKISNGATAMHRSLFDQYQYPVKFRNSEDVPVFSYVLANFDCGVLCKPINRIYKHSDSLRHNTDHAIKIGVSIVDEVFCLDRIDKGLLKYKSQFMSQRCLSLFRTLYLSNQKKEANHYYRMAISHNWKSILKSSYFIKFLQNQMK